MANDIRYKFVGDSTDLAREAVNAANGFRQVAVEAKNTDAALQRMAKRDAESIFLGTRTNLEKFQMELDRIQGAKDGGLIDAETAKRAQGMAVERFDPFGFVAQKKAEEKSAAEQIAAAKKRTQDIIATERAAVRQRGSAFIEMLNRDMIDSRYDKIAARARKANEENGKFTGSVNRSAFALQQLSFGLEDAASQFGTAGLAGAVRGASNNISAALMAFGPQAAVLGSLGATALMLGTNFLSAGKDAKELAKSVDTVSESLKTASELSRKLQSDMAAQRTVADTQRMGVSDLFSTKRDAEQKINELKNEQFAAFNGPATAIRKKMEEEQRSLQFYLDDIPRQLGQRLNGEAVDAIIDNTKNRLGQIQEMMKKSNLEIFQNVDSLPSGMMNEAEIESLRKQQQAYNELAGEIGNYVAVRKSAEEQIQIANQHTLEVRQMQADFATESAYWDEAEGWWEKIKTPAERLADVLDRINILKQRGLLTDEEAAKAMMKAKDEAERRDGLLSGANDIKSAEAGGIYANAMVRLQRDAERQYEIAAMSGKANEKAWENSNQGGSIPRESSIETTVGKQMLEELKKLREASQKGQKRFDVEVVGL